MDLLIMSLCDALRYEPLNKTYAMRISSEYSHDHLWSLKYSENWLSIASYVFDDVWPGMPGGIWPRATIFDKDLAQKILSEFKGFLPQIETLLVHCSRGKNRSPAVGIALNEIFDLGYDSDELKQKYPGYNYFVYDTLIETAKEQKHL